MTDFTFLFRFTSLVFFSVFMLYDSCDDFLTRNVSLGANTALRNSSSSSTSTSSSSTSSGSGGTETPADDDGDGLSNELERTIGTDPSVADSDHDGFDDGIEYVGRSGDPLNARLTPTPFSRVRILTGTAVVSNDIDSDGDGLGDRVEATLGTDPNDPDSDADGYSDGLEEAAGSNPLDASNRPVRITPPTSDGVTRTDTPPVDSDGDGLADEIEILRGSSSTAKDSDGDGYSDGIEFIFGSDPNDPASVPDLSAATNSTIQ